MSDTCAPDPLSIDVRSPWDGSMLGSVPCATERDVDAAVSRARAIHARGVAPAHERGAVLERAAQLITARREALATCICEEAGKPISAARVEVDRAAATLVASAIEARTLTGRMVPMSGAASGDGRLGFTLRHPVGVVAAITPFNFPLNLSCHKIGPAIAAGCPVVHKPASATPRTALLLRDLLRDAGLEPDMLHVVCGSGQGIGQHLVRHPDVRMVTFTGSSDVGWRLRQDAPRAHIALELGNSTPMIVLEDANIDDAADAAVRGAFTYAGQSCISIQRVIAHAAVHDALRDAVLARVATIAIGDPANEDTVVGPLISQGAAIEVRRRISASAQAGAIVHRVGSEPDGMPPTFVPPVVLEEVTPGMPIFDEELFGPALGISRVSSDDEAIEYANATRFGLQAGVFTSDITRAMRMVPQLHFGGVTINEMPTFRTDQMPYGGIKDSGNTREGPWWTVRAMTHEQLVVVAPGGSTR
jgi:acyl-CoA reductase-like NAD-dependent aldehyde dehydrogenase